MTERPARLAGTDWVLARLVIAVVSTVVLAVALAVAIVVTMARAEAAEVTLLDAAEAGDQAA